MYQRQWLAFDGSSAASSSFTAGPYNVADAYRLSLSYTTVAAVASRLTIQFSNDEGFRSPITTWNVWAPVTANGAVDLSATTYGRWIRLQRSSLESLSIVAVQMQSLA